MSPLSPEEIREFAETLERQLARLMKSMAVTEEAARPVELDQTAVGRLSRMDSLQNQHLTQNLRERERVQLHRIRSALERIEHGTYGICTECGGEVAAGRLFAFPEAERCGPCGGA